MAQPGILSWATTIRAAMANDPGRQVLDDRIQSHGFAFLDDYLEGILAQAKRDPLIDLVKTPGRKRVAPKKIRGTKPEVAMNASLEEKNIHGNRFQQALLNAKEIDDNDPIHVHSHKTAAISFEETVVVSMETKTLAPQDVIGHDLVDPDDDDEKMVEEILSSPAPPTPAHLPDEVDAPILKLLALPPTEQPNDLSVIVEDDEAAERTPHVTSIRTSIPTTQQNSIFGDDAKVIENPSSPPQIAMEVDDEDTLDTNITKSSSGQAFHSIPLNSPKTLPASRANSGHLTAPLPHIPQSQSMSALPNEIESTTLPSPDIASSVSADNVNTIKEAPTQFPSLPAPSPLRKSMRVQREPSIGVGYVPPMPIANTTVAGLGKRTSWLMKVREVNALELPSKRATLASAHVAPTGGTKRKSGDMLTTDVSSVVEADNDNDRKHKVAKTGDPAIIINKERSITQKGQKVAEENSPALPAELRQAVQNEPVNNSPDDFTIPITNEAQEGMMDRFKRTVEGLGRGKSLGKSLGGPAAAAALAEARAAKIAAEAKIAERDGRTVALEDTRDAALPAKSIATNVVQQGHERRFSVSDLVTVYEETKTKTTERFKEVEKGFKPIRASTSKQALVGDESTSTTPPNSPPPNRTSTSSFVLPSGPVFNKPPVFVPPALASKSSDSGFKLPSTSIPVPTASLGAPPSLPSPKSPKSAPALSAQSSKASVASYGVFDSQDDVPAWIPTTQDTEYTTATQSSQKMDFADDDDSWPRVDEKLAGANAAWTPFGFTKEDSMTWSTLPTESQRDTRSLHSHMVQNDFTESDLEGLGLEAGQSTVSLVQGGPERSESQMSMASSSSSQSQQGWASKLMNSVLGGSKSKKPQVPSIQRAAAAAKKAEEEKDKKALRLKEMENRRQLALQRKADEEKSKAVEEEKKLKEEGEKRKRERDETTDKRPLKAGTKKPEEDISKKRKITVEAEKKPESKQPPSKEKKDPAPSRMAPPTTIATSSKPSATLNKSGAGFKPSASNPALSSSAVYNAQVAAASATTSIKVGGSMDTKTAKSTTASIKGKAKAKVVQEDDLSQPAHQLKNQMAARAKEQLQAAKNQLADVISTQDIELPDINSEYSDSDDEGRPQTFERPSWAQSPELREALRLQEYDNPDDIFGPIKPLKMEELFRTRQSRFRARTSSANWTGTDRLTVEEQRDYNKRMGYR